MASSRPRSSGQLERHVRPFGQHLPETVGYARRIEKLRRGQPAGLQGGNLGKISGSPATVAIGHGPVRIGGDEWIPWYLRQVVPW